MLFTCSARALSYSSGEKPRQNYLTIGNELIESAQVAVDVRSHMMFMTQMDFASNRIYVPGSRYGIDAGCHVWPQQFLTTSFLLIISVADGSYTSLACDAYTKCDQLLASDTIADKYNDHTLNSVIDSVSESINKNVVNKVNELMKDGLTLGEVKSEMAERKPSSRQGYWLKTVGCNVQPIIQKSQR